MAILSKHWIVEQGGVAQALLKSLQRKEEALCHQTVWLHSAFSMLPAFPEDDSGAPHSCISTTVAECVCERERERGGRE